MIVTTTTPRRASAVPSYHGVDPNPLVNPPPWIQTITGRPASGSPSGPTRSGRGSPRPGAPRGRQHGRVLRTLRPELDRVHDARTTATARAGAGTGARPTGGSANRTPAGDDQVVLDGTAERARRASRSASSRRRSCSPRRSDPGDGTLSPPASLRRPVSRSGPPPSSRSTSGGSSEAFAGSAGADGGVGHVVLVAGRRDRLPVDVRRPRRDLAR